MLRRFFLIVLFNVWFGTAAFSQSFNVSGTASDASDGTPLVGLTVTVTPEQGNAPVAGAVTDSLGAFKMYNIPSGNYIVKASYIGYKDFQSTLNGPTNALTIRMEKDITTLTNVTIEGTPPPAQQKGDTTQFNANAFKTNPDASSEDLVNKMPGVTNTDGALKVQGEEVRRVLVDGKEFFGDDPTATLRNLPADVVDKIQIFDQGSEQARFTGFNDGNTSKTINIVTKPNRRNGTFGNAQAGIGTNADGPDADYYIGSFSVNNFKGDRRFTVLGLSNNINQQNFSFQDLSGMFGSGGTRGGSRGPGGGGMRFGRGGSGATGFFGTQPGIATTHAGGVNYSNEWKKLEWSGSYFINYLDNNRYSETDRDYFTSGDSTLTYNETTSSNNVSLNQRFNTKLEYKIDSMNTIVFQPRLNLQRLDNLSNTTAINQLDSLALSNVRTFDEDNYNVFTGSASLDYRHKFLKRGRTISFNGSYDGNGRTGDGFTQYVITNDSTVNDTTDRVADIRTNGYTVSGTVSYTEPVGQNGQLLFTYTPSFTNNTSDRITYDILNNGETRVLDTALTNAFDNTFNYHRGGMAYQYSKDKLNVTLETRYQQAKLHGEQTFPFTSTVDKTYDAILPQAELNYKFNQTTNLRFRYRSGMDAPSVTQLQNVIDVTNPLLLSAGNPNLKPERSHNMFVRYGNANPSQNTGLFLVLGGSYTRDYIGKQTIIAREDTALSESVVLSRGSQLTHPENFDYAMTLRSFLTYTWSLAAIKSNVSMFAGLTYANTPAIVNNARNRADQYNAMPGLTLSTNISENLDASLGYNATYSLLQNTLPEQPDNRFYQHTASLKINWIVFKRLVLNTNLNQQFYHNLSEGTDQSFLLWNAYAGYKMLKDRSLELRLSVNDIFNQNNTIAYTQTETYVEEVRTLSLKRYGMLSLVYTLKAFGGKTNDQSPPSRSGG